MIEDVWQKGLGLRPASAYTDHRRLGAIRLGLLGYNSRDLRAKAHALAGIARCRAAIAHGLFALQVSDSRPARYSKVTGKFEMGEGSRAHAIVEVINAECQNLRRHREELRKVAALDGVAKLKQKAIEVWNNDSKACRYMGGRSGSRQYRAFTPSQIASYVKPDVAHIGSGTYIREFSARAANMTASWVERNIVIPLDFGQTKAKRQQFALGNYPAVPIAMRPLYIDGRVCIMEAVMLSRFFRASGKPSMNPNTQLKMNEMVGMKIGYYATSVRTVDLIWAFDWDVAKAKEACEERIFQAVSSRF